MANVAKEDIKVDFDRSILAVSNSILNHFNVSPKYKTLKELDNVLDKNYKNVVYMIVDCLGTSILNKHLSKDSFLRKNVVVDISTVFPPTTASATTTFHSGLPPVSTGWLGWSNYFPQYDKVIENFLNTDLYTGKPIGYPSVSETILKYKSIYEQILESNKDIEYHKVFPPFDKNGVKSFEQMCERIADIVSTSNNKKIISAYWNEPDHSIHRLGVNSAEVSKIINDINIQIEFLASKLQDTVVIICADHGGIDIENISLNNYPSIYKTFEKLPAIEGRCLSFFIKKNEHKIFSHEFNKYFGEEFLLYTKKEFLTTNLFGVGNNHPNFDDFIGDFIAVAVGNKVLQYSTGERENTNFKANHAGFTPDEMNVSLIIIECK